MRGGPKSGAWNPYKEKEAWEPWSHKEKVTWRQRSEPRSAS